VGLRRPAGKRPGQLYPDIEDVIAAALEAELGPAQQLTARLTAGSFVAAFDTVERMAETRMLQGGTLTPAEIEHLLDVAVAFVTAVVADRGGDSR
jgi:hypothetical protein